MFIFFKENIALEVAKLFKSYQKRSQSLPIIISGWFLKLVARTTLSGLGDREYLIFFKRFFIGIPKKLDLFDNDLTKNILCQKRCMKNGPSAIFFLNSKNRNHLMLIAFKNAQKHHQRTKTRGVILEKP